MFRLNRLKFYFLVFFVLGNLVEIEIPLHEHDMAEVMADLFTMMEREKSKWQIDQYSIAQATLNTVFLDLARRPVRVPRFEKFKIQNFNNDQDSK